MFKFFKVLSGDVCIHILKHIFKLFGMMYAAIKRVDMSGQQEEVLTGSYYGGVYLVEVPLLVILADGAGC